MISLLAIVATFTALTALSPCAARVAVPLCAGRPATIVGTSGGDTLVGSDDADVIVGRDGDDRIVGAGGPDRVCGGAGNDIVRGGAGRDILLGAAGHDELHGGKGRDVIRGGAGRDRCDSPWPGVGLCEPTCPASRGYDGVRIAERRVNSIEAQQSTPTCFAEADFLLTADDQLVATHDPPMGGDCGDVGEQTIDGIRRCRLAGGTRVATLGDFLAVPLTEWYIDLKSNQAAVTDAEIEHSVEVAVRAITDRGREQGAVLLVYQVTPAVVDLLHENGIRAGMKGYPDSRAAAEAMVRIARRHRFELVCIRIAYVDRQMLEYSRARGVRHLSWELGERTPAQWRRLTDRGLWGLLTTRNKIPLAQRTMVDP
jgi:hypothetical protein